MTGETMTDKILNNFKSIKQLIRGQEGLNKKVKRMTEELDSLRQENKNLKRELSTIKAMVTYSD